MEISLAKYSFVASQAWAKSCRVATRATIPSFCRENFNSGDFFLRFFTCRVASSRVATRAIFISRTLDDTGFSIVRALADASSSKTANKSIVHLKL